MNRISCRNKTVNLVRPRFRGIKLATVIFATLFSIGLNAQQKVADSYNTAPVVNGVNPAICQTAFLLEEETEITGIAVYHFNQPSNTPSPLLSLRDTYGRTVGEEYQAVQSGNDQIASVPNLLLKPGWYQVMDNELPRASQNLQSCHCEFARVFGIPMGPAITTFASNFNAGQTQTQPGGPPFVPAFIVANPVELDDIDVYTFPSNGNVGPAPGTITLSVTPGGQPYATYPAISLPFPGPNNPSGGACVPNAHWLASPSQGSNSDLSDQEYFITMSDMSGWAFDAQSGDTGIVAIEGR